MLSRMLIENIKRLFSSITLVIIIIALSSCRSTDHKDQEDDLIPVEESVIVPLKIVYNLPKSYLTNEAFLSDGYYDFVTRDNIPYDMSNGQYGTANLIYTDYASATRFFLCNVPGCPHNSDDCTSYIAGGAGPCVLFPNYDESKLIALVTGIPGYDVESEEQLGKITMMNLDGSDRKILCRLKSKESYSLEDCIFIDDKAIYLTVTTIDENTLQVIKEIRRIDLDSGVSDVLLKGECSLISKACYDDNIVFYKFADIPSVYSSLNVHSGEVKELYSGLDAVMTIGHFNYYIHNLYDGTGRIDIIDLLDHSKRSISGIPFPPDGRGFLSDLHDNIIEWHYTLPDTEEADGYTRCYFINIDTGEFWEKTLTRKTYDGYDYTSPVSIFGETGDGRFIVPLDRLNCEVSFVDYQGIPRTAYYPDWPTYALISKEDYYNNIPNFTYIDDHVYIHK